MENKDLKFIKKNYGERFMRLCRTLFPSILEHEGLLSKLISDNFAPTQFLYEAITEESKEGLFTNFIMSQANLEDDHDYVVDKTPFQLMDEAGYVLFPECKSEKDIQSFRKYYEKNEEICTFAGGRLETCRVWFAVKKDVENIKRYEFRHPQREDLYGTSVISIQFSRNGNWISIKNRYNHTVSNPDCTFGNNLDNIIKGLSASFSKYYNMEINQKEFECFDLNSYVKADDGKRYKVNIDYYGEYCCENNVFISCGKVHAFNKDKFILMDNYLVDLQEKNICTYDYVTENFRVDHKSAFIQSIGPIQKMSVNRKPNGNRDVNVINQSGNQIIVSIDSANNIIGYRNDNITYIADNFLKENIKLESLSLPHVVSIGNDFLQNNLHLLSLNLPSVKYVGKRFLAENWCIKEVFMPNLELAGDCFLESIKTLSHLSLPMVKKVGDNFLYYNATISEIELPNIQQVGNNFMFFNDNLLSLSLPKIKTAGNSFLFKNKRLTSINIDSIESLGKDCLYENRCLETISLPKIVQVGGLLANNVILSSFSAPNLQIIGDDTLRENIMLEQIYLPSVQKIGENFLKVNQRIATISFPNLEEIGNMFMCKNSVVTNVNLPALQYVGGQFLMANEVVENLNVPNLKIIGSDFLYNNRNLKEVILPSVHVIGNNFMIANKSATKLEAPYLNRLGKHFMLKNKRFRRLKVASTPIKVDEILNI